MYKCKFVKMFECENASQVHCIVLMYKWINVHIYKCLNPKYTHGQLYNVQMYNVQMYNVQMYYIQMDNVPNISAVLGVILTFFFVGDGAV